MGHRSISSFTNTLIDTDEALERALARRDGSNHVKPKAFLALGNWSLINCALHFLFRNIRTKVKKKKRPLRSWRVVRNTSNYVRTSNALSLPEKVVV